MTDETGCHRCAFIPTGGPCLCRVPTDDDVPLWGEGE